MPTISNRGLAMPPSPIRKLVPLADAAKARGLKIYHLNIGQPDIPTPQVALDALHDVNRKILEYSPSTGFLSLRKKLVEYYATFHIHIQPHQIIITTGGSEAVLFALLACLNPGDEIIVPEPSYANYTAFALTAGATIRPLTATIDNAFALPPISQLEALITPRTKAILICNPNNPTGYLYTRDEMDQIRRLVAKHDLYLLSDEVYREFIYTNSPYISALHLPGLDNNAVLIDSVSKRYSECGLRLGMILTRNPDLLHTLTNFCQARLAPPLIAQIAAEASLDASPDYLRNVYDEYLARRNFLIDTLNRIPGVYSPIPMGAFYTIARLPVADAEHFCAWCLTDFSHNGQTLFLAPASGFYANPEHGRNEVRIAYVLQRAELQKAMIVLEEALKAYKKI
jgi:aspartate aminotransferase